MNRYYSIKYSCVCIVLALLLLPMNAQAQAEHPFPKPRGLVNDFANVIPPAYEQKIAVITRELLQKTGTPVVVVTMPDIGDAEYNDYANRLYSAWGIGKKGEDNGVLIFVTIKERKMRIETGYGVEGILPDGLVGEIRDRYMIPHLKQNKFGEGLLNGTIAVAQVIAKGSGVELTGQVPMKARADESSY
ncbi:MAG: TPM domain-containing protein [Deltaproteobacteria bacterium]|nr:TPM domain-containing protein [Deltaproteobacteria bacterium]